MVVLVVSLKEMKHVALLFPRDSDSWISNLAHKLTSLSIVVNLNGNLTFESELQRILKDVMQYLLQPLLITLQELRYSWGDCRGKLQLFLGAAENEVIRNFFNCFLDCEDVINLTKSSLLDLNKVNDVVHEIL